MKYKNDDIDKWNDAIDKTIERIDQLVDSTQPGPDEDSILYRSLEKVLVRIERQRVIRRRWKLNIAAAVVLLIGVFSVFHFTGDISEEYREITVAYGEKYIVALPDGSRVWLNAGSKLSYPKQFKGKTRQVNIEGEGFFDVTKKPEHPFIVTTNHLQVEVLGTTFNVHDYADENVASVSLETGKVKLKLTGNSKYEADLVVGKTAVYDVTSQNCNIVNSKEKGYSADWKEGNLSFFNTSISNVVKTLERKYNISISLVDDSLLKYSYTFRSKQEEFGNIFKRMEMITPIRIKQISEGHYCIYPR